MALPFNIHPNSTTSTFTPIPSELNTSLHKLPIAVSILKSALLISFTAIGFVGNSMLCIIVVCSSELRTRTNIFYVNLAVANIGVAVMCIPLTLVTFLGSIGSVGNSTMLRQCRINGIANSFWISACSFSLTATTVHKYLSVVKPLKRVLTKRKTFAMLFSVWMVSGLVSLMPTLQSDEIVYRSASGQCAFKTSNNRYEIYYLAFMASAVFICPTIINIVSYLLIFRALRRHNRRIRRSTIIDATGIRAQRRTIITLYAVFVVFLVTWLPFDVYSLFFMLGKEALLPDWFLSLVYMFAYSTCAQVPIIILYRGARLRQEAAILVSALCCGLKCCLQSFAARRKIANISGEDVNLDRRCSAWYIAGHRPVLNLIEDNPKVITTSAKCAKPTVLLSKIETCL
eukprot:gene3061-3524_t